VLGTTGRAYGKWSTAMFPDVSESLYYTFFRHVEPLTEFFSSMETWYLNIKD
jgi:hypothetical protein